MEHGSLAGQRQEPLGSQHSHLIHLFSLPSSVTAYGLGHPGLKGQPPREPVSLVTIQYAQLQVGAGSVQPEAELREFMRTSWSRVSDPRQ